MRPALVASTLALVGLFASQGARADEVLAEGSYWDDDHCTIFTDVTVRHADGSIATERVIGGEVDGIAQVQFALYGGLVSPNTAIDDYVQTKTAAGVPLRWANSCVFMTPDSEGTDDVTFPNVLAAIDGAAAAWTTGAATCSYMNLQRTEPLAVDVGYDGRNAVKFRAVGCPLSCTSTQWCRPAHGGLPDKCYDGGATAITTVTFIKDTDADAGEILDADVEVNTLQYAMAVDCEDTCTTLGQGTSGIVEDLQNTLTHEFGHVLGLDHTCWIGTGAQPVDQNGNPVPSCDPRNALPESVTSATMYNFQAPEEVSKRVPKPDDIAGVCADYPLAQDPKKCEPERLDLKSGCAVGTRGGSGWGLFFIAALCLAMMRRRRGQRI